MALAAMLLQACGGDHAAGRDAAGIDSQTPPDARVGCLGFATGLPPLQVGILTLSTDDLNGDGLVDMIGHKDHFAEQAVDVVLSNGDGTYGDPVAYPTASFVDYVTVGDLTGDGHPDILVVDASGELSMLPNRGDGTFGAPVDLFASQMSVGKIVMADLDADGLRDLVVLHDGSGVDVYRNLGNAMFSLTQSLHDGDGTHYPLAVAIADINHDLRPDLLLDANTALDTFEQLPDGQFVVRSSTAIDANRDFATSDFDNDGSIDVAILTDIGEVPLLRGGSGFTFSVATTLMNGGTLLAVGDIDGDGASDVVIGSALGLTSFRNLGMWSFSEPRQTAVDPLVSFALGHIDSGPTLDAVLTRYDGPTQLLPGTSDGDFAFSDHRFPTGDNAVAVASGDLDGDGHRDLVVAAAELSVLLGAGDGTFAPHFTLPTTSNATTAVAVGDLNRDGHDDVIAVIQADSSPSDGSAIVYIGDGAGAFEPGTFYALGPGSSAHLAVADLDGDGYLDVAVAREVWSGPLMSRSPGSLTLLRNDGTGNFTSTIVATQALDTESSFDTLGVADLDGDGDLDLIAGRNVFLNQGSTFVKISPIERAGSLVDLDGDGKPDVVAADSQSIGVLLGVGDGTFSLFATYPSQASPAILLVPPVTIADVDRDGVPDVLLPAFDGSAFGVLRGNADGTLAAPVTFRNGGIGNAALLVDDFNGDGRADVAITNQESNAVFVVLGNCSSP